MLFHWARATTAPCLERFIGSEMIEFLYNTLAKVGYTHPIHPAVTHLTVGMVIGAFLFGIVAWKLRHQGLARTAHHCIILALLAVFPTVLSGLMDWQHYYGGAWLFPIKMKLPLAGLLLILLVFALSAGSRAESISKRALIIYALCLVNVTALGYFGGELAYGGRAPAKPGDSAKLTVTADVEAGANLFNQTCSACHPNGGNSIKQNLPLITAPQLVNFETFLSYIRSPKARDGSQTLMPSFSPEKLSDQQAREVYQYIVKVLEKS
jgi:mono/diheme cytochrome c family protein